MATKDTDTAVQPEAEEPTAPAETATEAPPAPEAAQEAPAAEEAPAAPRVVFVETPAPPRNRGNRVVGGALALLGALLFALVYALGVFLLLLVNPAAGQAGAPTGTAAAFAAFLGSAAYWIPVLFFALGFVLLVLVLNRAGWWLHILGSILVAVFTYFASIGVLLLLDRVIFMTGDEAAAAFARHALDPRLILGAIIAREVAIWVGLAIAARGRRVKLRNTERRAAFERELAEKKAERERAAAGA